MAGVLNGLPAASPHLLFQYLNAVTLSVIVIHVIESILEAEFQIIFLQCRYRGFKTRIILPSGWPVRYPSCFHSPNGALSPRHRFWQGCRRKNSYFVSYDRQSRTDGHSFIKVIQISGFSFVHHVTPVILCAYCCKAVTYRP